MKSPAIHCRHDKLIPAADLQAKLHPDNPKNHPAGQLRLYAKIIKQNGWRRAVVLSKRSGYIVKGNGAVLAALAHGITHVPVEYQSYSTPATELQDLHADNALAQLGETDNAKLNTLLEKLDGTDPELAGILASLETPADPAAGLALTEHFQVIVECKDEAEQKRILKKLEKDGLTCQLLTF